MQHSFGVKYSNTFPFLEYYDVLEKIANRYDETDSTVFEMYDTKYGGTYDRPWLFTKLKLLNDHGDIIHHGR